MGSSLRCRDGPHNFKIEITLGQKFYKHSYYDEYFENK